MRSVLASSPPVGYARSQALSSMGGAAPTVFTAGRTRARPGMSETANRAQVRDDAMYLTMKAVSQRFRSIPRPYMPRSGSTRFRASRVMAASDSGLRITGNLHVPDDNRVLVGLAEYF